MHATTTLQTLIDLLGSPESLPDGWPATWEAAQAAFPGEVPFLAERFITDACEECAFPEEIRAELLGAAARVRRDADLERFAWFLFTIYHTDPMPPAAEVFGWPCVANPLGERAAMVPALVLLAGVPRLRARHAALGISSEVTRDTLGDIAVWMRHFHRNNGYWGLQNMGWPTNHFSGRLYRLGRLQFMHIDFTGPVHAFAHRATGRVAALSVETRTLRRDGYIDGTNEIFDEQAWTPTLELREDAAAGYPVHPRGYVLTEPVTLPLAEWRPALAPGDAVIDIHIPEGSKMDFDLCGESIRQAPAFFARHFPGRPPARAFVCGSWLLDAQFQLILPASSNIVRFLSEFYLYPLFSYDLEAFRRVFGEMPADLAAAPRDTALRRAMLDFKQAGGLLRCAGGFFLTDGLRWGAQRHQAEWVRP